MRYFDNEIYPVALVLSYDAESVDKEYYNACEGEEKPVYIKPTSEACTMFLSRRAKYYAMAVGILFNKKPTAKLMAHEALHAAVMMLDVGCNIPLNDSTEEAYAYMIGWITDCIDKFRNEVEFVEPKRD
jgi:hypothetical protein